MKDTKISEQQATYLAEVASGKKLQDIASEGYVSFQTVRYQLDGLRASMDAKTLPHLVAKGLDKGVIASDGKGGYQPKAEKTQEPRR